MEGAWKREESYYNYQYKWMSKKRNSAAKNDHSQQRSVDSHRNAEDIPDDKVRILQDNLVFVNALPHDVSSKQLLSNELHFPRYGPITKLILNPPYPNKKGVAYQAYITYTNQLDASLAIIALDGYKLSDRPLKVSFGTTKYCSHFVRGNSCPNPDCFYLHEIDRQRQVLNGDTRVIFKQQNAKALAYIIEHLMEVADKALESDVEQVQEGFPSITQTLDYLVDSEQITSQQLEKAFQQARAARRSELEVPAEPVRIQSMAPVSKQKEKQHPKLIKSNSHSTMCTPTKPEDLLIVQKKRQERQTKTQSKAQRQRQLVNKQNSREGNRQNTIGSRQLKLEQKIQKLIIKEIWKKNNCQCRSRFVKGITTSREECSRLRGIVQKFLIAQN